ncbi:uncharacterized protein LOC126899673 [Daktulosphaira vitifoliae]|uniref:uncharacterized protein LOC126899673 n=1 Tax=Daktulosphaira vitifoliae TaxID=58002 RepID=UPI0021AABC64|nr:uncharacterized protein LOC126899673 [Daktulosphaira vitifoliae]
MKKQLHNYLNILIILSFFLHKDTSSYTASTDYNEFLIGELKKHPNLNFEMIKQLKYLLNGEIEVKDKEIIMFLHSSYFDVARAIEMLKANYKYRESHKNYFNDRNPTSERMKTVINNMHMSILSACSDGWHIYAQIRNTQVKNFEIKDIFCYFFMMIEYLIKTQGAVESAVFTLNFKDFTISHFYKLLKIDTKKLTIFLQVSIIFKRIKISYVYQLPLFKTSILNGKSNISYDEKKKPV